VPKSRSSAGHACYQQGGDRAAPCESATVDAQPCFGANFAALDSVGPPYTTFQTYLSRANLDSTIRRPFSIS